MHIFKIKILYNQNRFKYAIAYLYINSRSQKFIIYKRKMLRSILSKGSWYLKYSLTKYQQPFPARFNNGLLLADVN